MAVSAGSVVATVGADVSSFVDGMRTVSTSLQSTTAAINKQSGVLNGLSNSFSGVTTTLKKVSGSFNTLTKFAGAGLGAIGAYTILPSIFGAAKSAVIDFNQQVDQATVALTNFLGSGTAAKKMIGDLQEFAAKTPFQFKDLLGTTQQMMAMGVAAEDVLPRMRAIGDAAAAMGGSPETLYRIQRALGQIQAKGRVQSEELLQLAEAGIPAYQYLADALETSTGDLIDTMRKGTVDASTAINAVLDGMANDFGGMMEEQSKTMMGALSTVMDYMQITIGAISRPLFNVLRDTFVEFSKILSGKAMTNASQKLAATMAKTFEAIKGGISAAVKMASPAIKSLVSAIKSLFTAFTRIAGAVAPVASMLASVLVAAFIAVANVVAPVVAAIAKVVEVLTRFQPLVQAVAALLAAMWVRSVYAATIANGKLAASVSGLFPKFVELASGIRKNMGTVKALGGSTFDTFRAGAQTAFTSVSTGARAMGAAIASSLGPMILIAAAVWAATKAFTAFSNRNKDAKERTKELTAALKENYDALRGDPAEIAKTLNNWRGVNDALWMTGENGERTTRAMQYVGISVKDTAKTLMDFKDNTYETAKAIAIANGETEEAASRIAAFVTEVDKGSHKSQQNYAKNWYMLSDAQIRLAMSLEELNDQAENLNLTDVVNQQLAAITAVDKNAMAIEKNARTLLDWEVAKNKNMSADEKAKFLYEAFTKEYNKYVKGLVDGANGVGPAMYNAAEAIMALLDSSKDGVVKVDDFAQALYGLNKQSLDLTRSNRDMRLALGQLFAEMKSGPKDFQTLTDHGYALQDMLNENGTAILNMGGNAADVERMMKSMVAQFIANAKAAGFNTEEVNGLLKSLGILDAMEVTARVKVDLEAAKKNLQILINSMKALGPDAETVRRIQQAEAEIARLEESLKNTGNFANMSFESITRGANGAAGSARTLKDITEAYKQAIKDQQKAVEAAYDAQIERARQAAQALRDYVSLSNAYSDYQEANQRAEEMRSRYREKAIDKEIRLLEEAIDAQKEYAAGVRSSIEGVLSFSDAFDEFKASIEAANEEGNQQISFLEALERQATRAQEFGAKIAQLAAAGLSKDGIKQIVEAGAQAGTAMADELLNGGTESISKANQFIAAIKTTAQTLGDKFEAEANGDIARYEGIADNIGVSFAQALSNRATKAKEFSDKVRTLIKMGLRGKALEEVLAAGVDAGTQIADQLIAGGEKAIQETMALQNALEDEAMKLSEYMSPYFDAAGVHLANALLDALVARLKQLPKILKNATPKQIEEEFEVLDAIKNMPLTVPSSLKNKPAPPRPTMSKAAQKAYGAMMPSGFVRVPAMAAGGIVTRPTFALIGEAGPEAVVPLSQMGQGDSITVNIYSTIADDRLPEKIVQALQTYNRRVGPARISIRN